VDSICNNYNYNYFDRPLYVYTDNREATFVNQFSRNFTTRLFYWKYKQHFFSEFGDKTPIFPTFWTLHHSLVAVDIAYKK